MAYENDPLTEKIIAFAIGIHRDLGPGLLESAYEECLCYELEQGGLSFRRQAALPVVYKSVRLECGYSRRGTGHHRIENGGAAAADSRGADANLSEAERHQNRSSVELQCPRSQGWD